MNTVAVNWRCVYKMKTAYLLLVEIAINYNEECFNFSSNLSVVALSSALLDNLM